MNITVLPQLLSGIKDCYNVIFILMIYGETSDVIFENFFYLVFFFLLKLFLYNHFQIQRTRRALFKANRAGRHGLHLYK